MKTLSVVTMFVMSLFLIPFVWAHDEEKVQAKSTPVVGAYAGVGIGDSSGSGSVMFEYYPWQGDTWYEKIRVHGQLWTDADDDQDTSNFAAGVAWCPTFGGDYALFGCAGLAYLTNDDTANINQHLQSNLAVGIKIKAVTAFLQHYSDASDGRDENFVMVGLRF